MAKICSTRIRPAGGMVMTGDGFGDADNALPDCHSDSTGKITGMKTDEEAKDFLFSPEEF